MDSLYTVFFGPLLFVTPSGGQKCLTNLHKNTSNYCSRFCLRVTFLTHLFYEISLKKATVRFLFQILKYEDVDIELKSCIAYMVYHRFFALPPFPPFFFGFPPGPAVCRGPAGDSSGRLVFGLIQVFWVWWFHFRIISEFSRWLLNLPKRVNFK